MGQRREFVRKHAILVTARREWRLLIACWRIRRVPNGRRVVGRRVHHGGHGHGRREGQLCILNIHLFLLNLVVVRKLLLDGCLVEMLLVGMRQSVQVLWLLLQLLLCMLHGWLAVLVQVWLDEEVLRLRRLCVLWRWCKQLLVERKRNWLLLLLLLLE